MSELVVLPRRFLEGYARLQLTPPEGMLIVCLLASPPRPSLAALARLLGVQTRTVRNWARRLERRGLLRRVYRRDGPRGGQTNEWDLTPLWERLERVDDVGEEQNGGALAEPGERHGP